jgi:glycosyltransferase involved in cell wall biosynthesis
MSTRADHRAVTEEPEEREKIRVLQLTTNAEARFFKLQNRTLEQYGVECTTLSVPGTHKTDSPRSIADYIRFFPQVLRSSFGSYDLVHANYGLTAPMALSQQRLPVVLSLWGSDLNGKYGRLSRACSRHCDAVIVMSEEMRERLGQECHVIPHGIDFELFRPLPRADARAELDWRSDAHHVLFPYSPQRTVKDYPRSERVVEAVDERLSKPVELHTVSGLPHDRMPVYMNASDALLLTSRSEGSPNVVKESLACNLPVVSTDVGDVRERLAGVEPSMVCRSDAELADALEAVLRRGERSNGREMIRDLSVEAMSERIRDIYDSVLD